MNDLPVRARRHPLRFVLTGLLILAVVATALAGVGRADRKSVV